MKFYALDPACQVYKRHWSFQSSPAAAAALFIATSPAHAQVKETDLYSFTGGSNGANPDSKLLADTSGPAGALRGLYGTAVGGGGLACSGGCGVVFRLVPPTSGKTTWTDSTLWSFTGGSDGAQPYVSGVSTTAKRVSTVTPLYGTTGGTGEGGAGFGTVFSLVGRKLTTLWTFTGGSDGKYPSFGEVLVTKNGTLYVAALGGGSSDCGTVIELTQPESGSGAWSERTIWTFSGGKDGCEPNAGLVMDKQGALYGTTEGNGYISGRNSTGTAFKLTPPAGGQGAWTEQNLATFKGSNGGGPLSPLTSGNDGVFFGTVYTGGTDNFGYAFELLPPSNGGTVWRKKVIYTFPGGGGGEYPWESQFLIDKNGVLYSNTSSGYSGVVYKLTPPGKNQASWTETTLYESPSYKAGYAPLAGLVADGSGTLYGTFSSGGPTGDGLVFSLTGTGFVPP